MSGSQHKAPGSAGGYLLSLLVGLIILVPEIKASAEFKHMRIKNDWRGVTNFIAARYPVDYLLISEIIGPVDQWDPGYYGFGRYYRGKLPGIMLMDISTQAEAMHHSKLRPLMLLFRKRHFYLTLDSQYGILPIGYPDSPELSRIINDPDLEITDLTGFSVVSLKADRGNLAASTLDLLEKLIAGLDQDSSVTHLHLMAAALGQSCGDKSAMDHLAAARRLARPSQRQTVDYVLQEMAKIKILGNC